MIFLKIFFLNDMSKEFLQSRNKESQKIQTIDATYIYMGQNMRADTDFFAHIFQSINNI